MALGSVLFVLAILVLVGAYVLRPLSEPAATGVGRPQPKLSRLQAQRERVLDAIQELDADHALGKVLTENYRGLRRQLALQGAAVMRQIDELEQASPQAGLEAELEARVAQLKEHQPQPAASFCPHCGRPAVTGDRFCSHCGTALQE